MDVLIMVALGVGRGAILAAIAAFSYAYGRDDMEDSNPRKALTNSFIVCALLALFYAASIGSPSCAEYDDPIRGGCTEYNDDGYTPDRNVQYKAFGTALALMFGSVVAGFKNRKSNGGMQ